MLAIMKSQSWYFLVVDTSDKGDLLVGAIHGVTRKVVQERPV